MKVAIAFYGQPRFYKQAHSQWKRWIEELNADVYIHTWWGEDMVGELYPSAPHAKPHLYDEDMLVRDGVIEDIKELYKPKDIEWDSYHSVEIPKEDSSHFQFWTQYRVKELVKESGIDYDIVIRTRMDLHIGVPIPLTVKENIFYTSSTTPYLDAPNDLFSVSDLKTFFKISDIYLNLDEFSPKVVGGKVETYLSEQMKREGVFNRVFDADWETFDMLRSHNLDRLKQIPDKLFYKGDGVVRKKPTLHMIGLFHTVPSSEYSHCAFSGKVLRFPKMMKRWGWDVIEYSNEGSESQADEIVQILTKEELSELLGNRKREEFYGNSAVIGSQTHQLFEGRLIQKLKERVKPNDFILHPFGFAHPTLLEMFPHNIHIETGIGYPINTIMDKTIKIFESYAYKHFYYGNTNKSPNLYDFVVPNYFDLDDWDVNTKGGDYIAYLGRITTDKGMEIIKEIGKRIDKPIIICGQGDYTHIVGDNITYKPPISGRERSNFLGNAYCTLVPSMYVEPFGGVSIESMLCGTPVLTTDFGAFTENVIDGVSGFRNSTLQDWLDSIERVKELDRGKIAEYARNKFSLEVCGEKYNTIFLKIWDLYRNGWYTIR